MDSEKKVYEVKVAGVPLKLRSSHEQETVNDLVGFVNQEIEKVLDSNGDIPHQSVLLLAALNMAEELTNLKKLALTEIDKIEGQTKKLIAEIDASPISQVRMDV